MSTLVRLQRFLLERAGNGSSITSATSADWRSTTFEGERHQVCLSIPTPGPFIEWANDGEGELMGCVLAEVSIVEIDGDFITVEALVLNN